jgi:hypothetical protein
MPQTVLRPWEAKMKSKSDLEGGSGNGASIAPLEPGRPDVMPNPPGQAPGREKPMEESDEAQTEDDAEDGDVNSSMATRQKL